MTIKKTSESSSRLKKGKKRTHRRSPCAFERPRSSRRKPLSGASSRHGSRVQQVTYQRSPAACCRWSSSSRWARCACWSRSCRQCSSRSLPRPTNWKKISAFFQGYGRHKGGLAPWIMKCDILLFSILVEELFIFTFGIGKMNFHHCLPPCKKSFWPPPGKSTISPLEIIFPKNMIRACGRLQKTSCLPVHVSHKVRWH